MCIYANDFQRKCPWVKMGILTTASLRGTKQSLRDRLVSDMGKNGYFKYFVFIGIYGVLPFMIVLSPRSQRFFFTFNSM
jgi:hypothetical protein